MSRKVPVTIWHGCYAKQWGDRLTPACYTHPAKFAPSLIERVIAYGAGKGYWARGEILGDPCGGVAGGGVVAADLGYNWVGVELEKQFVQAGNENIEAHRSKWTKMGRPIPRLVQGDSRNFAAIVREIVSGIVTSPPFTHTPGGAQGVAVEGYKKRKRGAGSMGTQYLGEGGERAASNIEKLKPGTLDGAITSPPYETIRAGAVGLNHLPAKKPGQQSGRTKQKIDTQYGDGAGQIAQSQAIGKLGGIVTSPPYERNTAKGHVGADKFKDPTKFASGMSANGKGHSASPEARVRQLERDKGKSYGSSDGQIGRAAGETYWAAMRKVYASSFEAIKPGGYMAVIVKDYVRNWKRVPLCDDTMKLLEYVGFEPVERIHAMVVEKLAHHTDLFTGQPADPTQKTRKSFFRRLQEQRGAPPIDYEQVLIVRKPHNPPTKIQTSGGESANREHEQIKKNGQSSQSRGQAAEAAESPESVKGQSHESPSGGAERSPE